MVVGEHHRLIARLVPHAVRERHDHEVERLPLRLRPAAPSGVSHEVRRQPEAGAAADSVRFRLPGLRRGGGGTGEVAPGLRDAGALAAGVGGDAGRAVGVPGGEDENC